MTQFIEILDLRDITLFGQDWGSLIGLRVATENESRFSRIAIGNGALPTGDQEMSQAFLEWREFARSNPGFDIGQLFQRATISDLSEDVVAAYDAPFPDEDYKAGARAFPNLVPAVADDPASEANRRAWAVLMSWTKPFLTTFSDKDPILGGGERVFKKLVPGAAGQAHVIIEDAGHFLQEDKGEELADVLFGFISPGTGACP
jgi:haloalkane dehalogenase